MSAEPGSADDTTQAVKMFMSIISPALAMSIRIAALGPAGNFTSNPGTNISTKGSVKNAHPTPKPARLAIITSSGVARGPLGTRLFVWGAGMPAATQALTFMDARSRNMTQFATMGPSSKLGGSVFMITLEPSATAMTSQNAALASAHAAAALSDAAGVAIVAHISIHCITCTPHRPIAKNIIVSLSPENLSTLYPSIIAEGKKLKPCDETTKVNGKFFRESHTQLIGRRSRAGNVREARAIGRDERRSAGAPVRARIERGDPE